MWCQVFPPDMAQPVLIITRIIKSSVCDAINIPAIHYLQNRNPIFYGNKNHKRLPVR